MWAVREIDFCNIEQRDLLSSRVNQDQPGKVTDCLKPSTRIFDPDFVFLSILREGSDLTAAKYLIDQRTNLRRLESFGCGLERIDLDLGLRVAFCDSRSHSDDPAILVHQRFDLGGSRFEQIVIVALKVDLYVTTAGHRTHRATGRFYIDLTVQHLPGFLPPLFDYLVGGHLSVTFQIGGEGCPARTAHHHASTAGAE